MAPGRIVPPVPRPVARLLSCACAALLFALSPAAAPADDDTNPALPPTSPAQKSEAAPQPSAEPADFWHRDTLSGDWGGLRPRLAAAGVTVTLNYISDMLANVLGGIKQGATYGAVFEPQIDADLQKLFGWDGATARISMLQIHGTPLSPGYVGNLMGVSEIEAPVSTRLYDLWLQQNALNGRLSIRAGMFTADEEFFVSDVSAIFVNSTFGWEGWPGNILPGGGAAYPLPVPAVRVRFQPIAGLTLLAAIFDGDPTGHSGSNSPLTVPPTGTVISFNGGAFLITEADYAVNKGKEAAGLPATYKLGAWFDSSTHFQDQQFDMNGISLAGPGSDGVPRDHAGDWGIYGIVDHMLYRVPGTEDQGLSAFVRAGLSPDDRSVLNFYADTGMTYRGLIPGRPRDIAGIAVAMERISDAVRALDSDIRLFTMDPTYPIRDHEIAFEVTYQAQVTPWMVLQPDLQAIFHPDGYVLNSNGTIRRNALVIGAQTALTF